MRGSSGPSLAWCSKAASARIAARGVGTVVWKGLGRVRSGQGGLSVPVAGLSVERSSRALCMRLVCGVVAAVNGDEVEASRVE